jgi:hypothetical protein
MPSAQKLDTHHKALTLNLDPSTFGSFAEIGAGQEVARWFLIVGGASGTVAKTISAYDKEVSDDLYGSGTRYVSRQRLEAMLESEWAQLLTQLERTRGSQTRFFSFVDTVSARNFAGTEFFGHRFGMERNERLGLRRTTACPASTRPPLRVSSRKQFPRPHANSRSPCRRGLISV